MAIIKDNKVINGVEVTTIYGKVAEGKTSTLIKDYMAEGVALLSNEMTEKFMCERILHFKPDLKDYLGNLGMDAVYAVDWKHEYPRIYNLNFGNKTTLLLDGNGWTDTMVTDIIKFHPQLTKIVRTCQLCRDGSMPREY